jgi:hypothetical protein
MKHKTRVSINAALWAAVSRKCAENKTLTGATIPSAAYPLDVVRIMLKNADRVLATLRPLEVHSIDGGKTSNRVSITVRYDDCTLPWYASKSAYLDSALLYYLDGRL